MSCAVSDRCSTVVHIICTVIVIANTLILQVFYHVRAQCLTLLLLFFSITVVRITDVLQMFLFRLQCVLMSKYEVVLYDIGIADEVRQLERFNILCIQSITRWVVGVDYSCALVVQTLIRRRTIVEVDAVSDVSTTVNSRTVKDTEEGLSFGVNSEGEVLLRDVRCHHIRSFKSQLRVLVLQILVVVRHSE